MALKHRMSSVTFESDGLSFLKIGKEATLDTVSLDDFKNSKYKKIDKIWGTLGWANDNPLEATGTVEFSQDGNFEHRGITAQITELLNAQNVEIGAPNEIRERFIDLSTINFKNIPKSISSEDEIQLRFDLFIDKEEGALVYLQETPKTDVHSSDAEVYLITPESTDSSFSQDRYRLTYIFTYTFGKELEYKDNKVLLKNPPRRAKKRFKFALKVLTFPRKETHFKAYVSKASGQLNEFPKDLAHRGLHKLGNKKYKLYNYKVTGKQGEFKSVSDYPIDPKKKTLLLIHGTFSTVMGSYGELTEIPSDEDMSFLTALVRNKHFDQIIAFDHPTASQSVQDNAAWLLGVLGDIRFTQPIDVITTSRGALIGEYLTASPIALSTFRIKQVLMFAPAHGSDLLKIAKGFDRLLSFFGKVASTTGWGYILAIAQFSINAIRTQPGLEVMMPGSDPLNDILRLNPIQTVQFKAMVGDYDGVLIKKRFKRWLSNGLDKLLKLAFKSENDWVIGCPEQRKQLHGSNARYHSNFEYKCIHGKQFDPSHPKIGRRRADVRTEIQNYFSPGAA